MEHISWSLFYHKFCICLWNQRPLEASLCREFLKRALCIKKRKRRSGVQVALAVACSNGVCLLFERSLPKLGTWWYQISYWLKQQSLALALSPCASLRGMRMCCLWEDRTSLNLKASPWVTLLPYQTGFAGKKKSLTPSPPPKKKENNFYFF